METATTMICAALLFFVGSSQQQTAPSHLRVYKDFVEISRPLLATERFTEFDWKSVDPQFIHISNCGKDYNIRIRSVDRDTDGQTVYVRRGDKHIQAQLINSAAGLVQMQNDSEYGDRYLYVDRKDIEYVEEPSGGYTLLIVEAENHTDCAENATISYVQTNMRWIRNHELIIDHNDSVLKTWATLVNQGLDSKHGDVVELIAGGVGYPAVHRYSLRSYEYTSSIGMASSQPSESDLHGVKLYRLPSGVSLGPKESVRTPLITQTVVTRRLSTATNFLTLNPHGCGRFNRVYEVIVKKFIPDGRVVVREQGRIVGDTKISDPVNPDGTTRITFGTDVDLSYKRNITNTYAGNDTTFYLNITMINKRASSVNVEYTEEIRIGRIVSAGNEVTNGLSDMKISFTAQKVLLAGTLDGNSTGEILFEVMTTKGKDNMVWK